MKHCRPFTFTGYFLYSTTFFLLLNCFFSLSLQAQEEAAEKLLEKASGLMESEQYESAYLLYEEVTTIDLKNKFAYNGMGNCYKQMEKMDSAVIFYKKAIEIDETFASAYYNLGSVYVLIDDVEKALENYNQYITLEPYESDGYVSTGYVFNSMGRPDTALFYFQKALELDSKEKYHYYYLADTYQKLGRIDTGIYIIDQAIAMDTSDVHSYFMKATLYDQNEDYEKAMEGYSLVLEKDDTHIEARKNRAFAAHEIDDSDSVLKDVENLLTKTPIMSPSYFMLLLPTFKKGTKTHVWSM